MAIIIPWLLLSSCTGRMSSVEEYNQWLNHPEHGCSKAKTIAGIHLAVKYLPPGYSVLKDIERVENPTKHIVDSLYGVYGNTLMFLMNLGPETQSENPGEAQPSVMDAGVTSYADYADRMHSTNFGMSEYITLYAGNTSFKPVYCIVENLYELSEKRNFLVLFADKSGALLQAKDYVFVYNDPFFNIGTVQLMFDGDKLRQAKELSIR